MQEALDDDSVFPKLSTIYNLPMIPMVSVGRDDDLDGVDPFFLAKQAERLSAAGICVDFSGMVRPSMSGIARWLRRAASVFTRQSLSLCVRLTDVLQYRPGLSEALAMLPAVQLAAPVDSLMYRLTSAERNVLPLARVRVDGKSLSEAAQITIPTAAFRRDPVEVQVAQLEQKGREAFEAGDYHAAISSWESWEELEAWNPEPPMLLGDAHVRAKDWTKALRCYDRSLELDPTQVKLAIRRTRLLEGMGRMEDAIASINLYARLFPEDHRVTCAQARCLHDAGRDGEARALLDAVLARDPQCLDAIGLRFLVSRDPGELRTALDVFHRVARTPGLDLAIMGVITENELLSRPGAHGLADFVDALAGSSTNDAVIAAGRRLRPPAHTIAASDGMDSLSQAWHVEGGTAGVEQKTIRLGVDNTHKEVCLRLLGSERLREAFVEATIEDCVGSFWLYARRNQHQYVRFGIDDLTERVHLQVWRESRIVSQISESWDGAGSPATLRLEIRADGAVGYVDGKRVCTAPEAIPRGMGLGWLGASVWSLDYGRAGVMLSELKAGPLPLRLTMLPALTTDADVDTALSTLRASISDLTAVCPQWFTVQSDGAWRETDTPDRRLLCLFAKYHRKHLLPVAHVPAGPEIKLQDILAASKTGNGDGVILLFSAMPTPATLNALDEELNTSNAIVIAMALRDEGAMLRGLGAARNYFPGQRATQPIQVIEGVEHTSPKPSVHLFQP